MTTATISFFRDTDVENPVTECDWDDLTFYYGHRRYNLGGIPFSSKYEMDRILEDAEEDEDFVFPVYMYDHSGCTVSLSPFSCPFDSGIVGFVIIKNGGAYTHQSAQKYAEGFVEALDDFLTGEVWGFIIEDDNGEDIIDSCGGFFGDDIRTNGMLEHIDEEYHQLAIDAWEDRF